MLHAVEIQLLSAIVRDSHVPQQRIQGSQLILDPVPCTRVELLQKSRNDFLSTGRHFIKSDMTAKFRRHTLSFPSTLVSISDSTGVQLTGGFPPGAAAPATLTPLAFAIPHKLPSPSACGGWSPPENRYDTPGCGESRPRGPIMCCEECGNGEGPRILQILL